MALIDVTLAETRECPFNAFLSCKGEKCMAGYWIIRGVKGEIYPCKLDIFAATYDPV